MFSRSYLKLTYNLNVMQLLIMNGEKRFSSVAMDVKGIEKIIILNRRRSKINQTHVILFATVGSVDSRFAPSLTHRFDYKFLRTYGLFRWF
jgi:hypothetical protein